MLFVLWWGPWLFTREPDYGLTAEQELKAKSDVRTALVQAVGGLAVAGGLIVTYRTYLLNQRDQENQRRERQRAFDQNQEDLRQRWKEQERTYELNVSALVTETYTKAVEQLGHDEAPVRLGALHSLERLAQDNPPRRQTVVDVLCAYLRLPYTPSNRHSSAGESNASPVGSGENKGRDAAQELQVRQTAQRLLFDHIRRPHGFSEGSFWPGMSVDLTGATLYDVDLTGGSVSSASFRGVTFLGGADFSHANFESEADFSEAVFTGTAGFWSAHFTVGASFVGATFRERVFFHNARFVRAAAFHRAHFEGDAEFEYVILEGGAAFNDAVFSGAGHFKRVSFPFGAWFTGAKFEGVAAFIDAVFNGDAFFNVANFTSDAWFTGAEFHGDTRFSGSVFCRSAGFVDCQFLGAVRFVNAAFGGNAGFGRARFSSIALFAQASFSAPISFRGAKVLHVDDPDLNRQARREWPDGWMLRKDESDPTQGTLVWGDGGEAAGPVEAPSAAT
ncbi:pentapeptide repeat-containing protein [Geodermatophilus siccatus]|uniref:pentapeptide repeat-containing protein n=1 Tax=Geodermatophilus siccatus TaxID=1137991 RepID=UPI0015875A9B|nr:pentapeptide repeat-containing protein [Geodermatophilus siccatus]